MRYSKQTEKAGKWYTFRMHRKRKAFLVFMILVLFGGVSSDVVIAASSVQQVEQEKTQLQRQLQDIERQIVESEKTLVSIKGQKKTLQNTLQQLAVEQEMTKLQIKAITLEVRGQEAQLKEVVGAIDENTQRIDALKSQISETLVNIYQNDQRSFFLVLFSNGTLFEAITELEDWRRISSNLSLLLDQFRTTQDELMREKVYLDETSDRLHQLLAIQALAEQTLKGSVATQSTLLSQTKGKEQTYQALLSDSKKQATAIRSRLYQLLDVGKQITFGQAVEIAQTVSATTGVRAAFLLAILTQESNIGRNVGTCNRPGDPPSKSWKVIMKPERDQEPFKTITTELGLNPDTTAVSCPMRDKNGKQIGWGGAMGPAQFIPSTWMGYRAKVTAITGLPANPWDIRDAFIASAIKLAADGATSKDGEWAAAMKYFSGSTNVRFRFYGDNVAEKADAYQKDIDALGK